MLQTNEGRNIGRDLMPQVVKQTQVSSYHFHGYWADVGTVQSYYEANMALLVETPALDLYDLEWTIHTRSEERPAVEIGAAARAGGNLLCDGCRIYGQVSRSIIGPGVVIEKGAVVRDSILMTDAVVEAGAIVDRCIIDKDVRIGAGSEIGAGEDNMPNQRVPEHLNTGLTVIGRRARIPANIRIGRNVVVRPRVTEAAFGNTTSVASGETVGT
jgi:glucose-1-phosphate adenylyltransferase